jgi:hypothetical protein
LRDPGQPGRDPRPGRGCGRLCLVLRAPQPDHDGERGRAGISARRAGRASTRVRAWRRRFAGSAPR